VTNGKTSSVVFSCVMLLIFCSNTIAANKNLTVEILPLKERALIIDDTTAKRIGQLLPTLMQQTEIDMWLLISREYNEDPILKTVLPATWMWARRTTIFVFVRQGDKVKALAISPYKVGDLVEPAWDKEAQPNQWQALVELMQKYDPQKTGINQSEIWSHTDGLVATGKQRLLAELPKKYQQPIVSAEALAVRWLETRIPEEIS
jgi:hypothetical protein